MPRTANPDAVALAYRRAAVRTHPDRGGTAAEFTRVRLAWEQIQATWTEPAASPAGELLDEDLGYVNQSVEHTEVGTEPPMRPRVLAGVSLIAVVMAGFWLAPGEPARFDAPLLTLAGLGWLTGLGLLGWLLLTPRVGSWLAALGLLTVTGWHLADGLQYLAVAVVVVVAACAGYRWIQASTAGQKPSG